MDCDDANGSVWSVPGEGRDLHWTDEVTLAWSAPAEPGGLVESLRYDLLRSASPDDFEAGTECVASDLTGSTSAQDSHLPDAGQGRFYLVRAENACGSGSLGPGCDGHPRPGHACP